MQDPVVIETGRSYEKKAILEWFGRGRATDPLTGEELSTTKVVPNSNLRLIIRQMPEQRVMSQKIRAQVLKTL